MISMRLRMQETLYFWDSGTLFTKHALITVANNNLLFKHIYTYVYNVIVVVLNRVKYFVKTPIDIVIQ